MPTLLALEHLHLAYDTARGLRTVVPDLNLELERGQIGCLLGASGCGKSTVLRAIAGDGPERGGRIVLLGRVLSSPQQQVAPELRRVGMMFQDYALFPHMTVAGNVGFGLRRASPQERAARVGELLELVGLSHAQDSYPHELSGGQQQRVALARALAPAPELLLLDEPFSNLDTNTREHLAQEVRHILQATGHTAILVTHNQAEALAIADHIGSLSGGQLQYWDSPSAFRQRLGDEQKQKKELLAA